MKNLLKFINESPTAFHAAENVCDELIRKNYIRLNENEKWNLKNTIFNIILPKC